MNGLAFQIAKRELAGGFKGFAVYLACLSLGAFAIAATGSVTQSFHRGLIAEQRTLLGGDIAFSVLQRRITQEERQWMEARGAISESVTLNVMGQTQERRRQVDLRGVDDTHPLIGAPVFSDKSAQLDKVLAFKNNRWGAAVSASLLEHFSLSIGDYIDLGPFQVEIRAELERESDGLGTAGSFGPHALVHLNALIEAERLTNGQLFRASYRMIADGEKVETIAKDADALWSDAGLRVRQPEDAVDGLQDILSMLNIFLSVIGVSALVAGGVGVAQATTAFLTTRIPSIATFKAMGANTSLIRNAYGLQLAGLAAFGALIGVLLGALVPFIVVALFADRIALPQILGIYPLPLLKAMGLSILAAALFALPALGRASATPPAALFRKLTGSKSIKLPVLERCLTVMAALALIGVAALTSPRPMMTLMLLVGAGVFYFILLAAALLIRKAAQFFARRAKGLRRLALSNLGGPGSLAPTIAPALGLGLALLTVVATVQANLLRQVRETAPQNIPSLIFSQIPGDRFEEFDKILASEGIAIDNPDLYRRAPQMLGRVISLKGKPLVREEVAESERWVVDQEIGLTYLAKKPPEAQLTQGFWWQEDYAGPLLVSIEHDAAKGLGLEVGDEIGFRIFGRELEAEVTSLRIVDWGGFGTNTAFILSPGLLEAANPRHLAIAKASRDIELALITVLGRTLPDVIVFQTSNFLAVAARLLGNIAMAINAAASIVTIAGLLVLIGAFAAMTRKRREEAALLKTFGASKNAILGLYAGEFAIAGAVAAFLGVLMGVGAAYPVVINIFEAQWHLPWDTILLVSGFAILAAGIGGIFTGLVALSQPPARVLRAG